MLLDKLINYSLILASGSPRRVELMRAAGFIFKVNADIEVDESYPGDLTGSETAVYLAEKKSLAYTDTLQKDDILITADTIVYQSGMILNKPENQDQARKMLTQIADSNHKVYTGVCIRSDVKRQSFYSVTDVKFGRMKEEEIQYYIDKYKPFDKAGSYGIQEWIGIVGVEEIRGSYFNVMGLPVHRLYRELENFINV